jgi:hypothetical protein
MAAISIASPALAWLNGIEQQLSDILACAHAALSHLESQSDDERDHIAYGVLRTIKEQAEEAACLQQLRALIDKSAEQGAPNHG